MLRRLLIAGTLALIVTPAEAGPLAAVGAGIVGALTGPLGTLLTSAAGIAISLLRPKPKPPKPDSITKTVDGEEGEGYIAIGRMAVQGKRIFGGSKDVWTYRIIVHSFGKLVAIEEYKYGGYPVVVEGYGDGDDAADKIVTSPPFATQASYRSFLRLQTRFGGPNQSAYRRLIDAFRGQWTPDHRGDNLVKTLISLISPGQGNPAQQKKFQKVVGSGIKPLEILGRWQEPYDPRIPGSAWTINGPLVALWARQQLPGFSQQESIGWSDIGDLADVCDVEVDTILPIEFDARVEIQDDEGDDTNEGEVLVDGDCVADYDYAYRVLTTEGTSVSNTRPNLRFFDVLTVGKATKLKLTLSSADYAKFHSCRFGSVAPTVTKDEVDTYNGSSVRVLEMNGTPDGETFAMRFDGTGGPLEVKIDWLEFQVSDVRHFRTASGGEEGPIDTDWVERIYASIGVEEVRGDNDEITLRLREDSPDAEFEILPDDLFDSDVQDGPEGFERPNICKIWYREPLRGYRMTELPLQRRDHIDGSHIGPDWARNEAEIAMYGEREFELNLAWCDNAMQACEIGRREFLMARSSAGILLTGYIGRLAWGRRVCDVHFHPRTPGGSVRVRRCYIHDQPEINPSTQMIEIPVTIIPDELLNVPFDPEIHGCLPAPAMPEPPYEAELETPNPPTAACWVKYQTGGSMSGAYETRCKFNLNTVPGATVAEANMRLYVGSEPDTWQGMDSSVVGASGPGSSSLTRAWKLGDHRDEKIDFRVRAFNDDDDASDMSDLLEIVSLAVSSETPAIPLVVLEIDEGTPSATVTVTSPSTLSVVKICIAYSSFNSQPSEPNFEFDARPEDRVVHTFGFGAGTTYFFVWAETTDGTEGPAWSNSYLVDP